MVTLPLQIQINAYYLHHMYDLSCHVHFSGIHNVAQCTLPETVHNNKHYIHGLRVYITCTCIVNKFHNRTSTYCSIRTLLIQESFMICAVNRMCGGVVIYFPSIYGNVPVQIVASLQCVMHIVYDHYLLHIRHIYLYIYMYI